MSFEAIAPFAFEQLDTDRVANAHQTPQDLLSSVLAEAERIRHDARTLGEQEGYAAGMAAAQEQVQAAVRACSGAAAALHTLEQEVAAGIERTAVELALKLAEQVLAGALDVQPERVLDIARNALRRLADRRQVTLIVNPADLEQLTEALPAIRGELGGIDQLDVQADRRVAPGGAIAHTQSGEIDATIDTQLERAREIVAAVLRAPEEDTVAA